MLNLRMNAPNGVTRLSRSVLHAVSDSVFVRMLRNLSMVKGFLSRPTRVWRNSTGPGPESLTPRAVMSSTGEVMIIAAQENTMSKARLTARLSTTSCGIARMFMSRTSPTTSTVAQEGR